MTISALGNRYANALADVVTAARSAVRPDAAVAELKIFAAALRDSHELHSALTSPAVPPARKRAVVGRIADQLGTSKIVRNFLYVLVDHRRISHLSEVTHSFERIVDERLGFVQAEISTATELTQPQRSLLGSELERLAGGKVRTRFSVDEKLIGGAVARIGSTVYDGSVRGQLHSLGRRLGAEV
jgi:F-type H+-transporting ATPase subunit delta